MTINEYCHHESIIKNADIKGRTQTNDMQVRPLISNYHANIGTYQWLHKHYKHAYNKKSDLGILCSSIKQKKWNRK